MKFLVVLMLAGAMSALGQSDPFQDQGLLDSARSACEPLKKIVDDYNKQHPDAHLDEMCTITRLQYPKGTHEVHYPLEYKEIGRLDYLRAKSTVAYTEESEYERYLLRKHGHPAPAFGDRNWHYVGIRIDDHFITEELPNP